MDAVELELLEWELDRRDELDGYRQQYAPVFVVQDPEYDLGELVYVYPLDALGVIQEYYWCPECGWSYDVLLQWPIDGYRKWQIGEDQVVGL